MNSINPSSPRNKESPNYFQRAFSKLTVEKAGKVALVALVVVGGALIAAGIGFHLPALKGIGIGFEVGGAVFTLAYCGANCLSRLFKRLYPFEEE